MPCKSPPITIRIWGGVRDASGISRIKYIDVAEDDPGCVKAIAQHVALDIGAPGCFDDNGMILGDVIRVGEKLYMYYVGFQHVQKVKFMAFSGLAISDGDGANLSSIFRIARYGPHLDGQIRALHSYGPV